MRLGGCILVEVLVAGTMLVGAGFAAERGAVGLVAEIARRDHPSPELRTATHEVRRDLSQPVAPTIVEEPGGTFLGMADEILLDRVRRQPILRFKVKSGGSSLSFRIDLADGTRAAWKPSQTNLQTIPRKEIAAYRLNRLLGLNAVPPAAPRPVTRDELFAHIHPESVPLIPRIQAETIFDPSGKTFGEASYWIPEIKDSGLDTPDGQAQVAAWLAQGQPIPVDKRSLAGQVSDLVVFDFLTANPDRYSGGNMKMSPDGSRLYFMDNTMSFFIEPQGTEGGRKVLQRTQRFSRHMYEALPRIDERSVEQALAAEPGAAPYELLTPAEIKAVVARRDVVRQHIDQLAAQFGPRNVLVFP